MEKDYAECANLKIFRQNTKFLSDKMAEKNRFREYCTTQNAGKCHIGGDKKSTTFNRTCFHSFLQNQRNYDSSERRADYTCNINNMKVYR